jgi:hypothetical protein
MEAGASEDRGQRICAQWSGGAARQRGEGERDPGER